MRLEHNQTEVERTALSVYKSHPRHRAYCLGLDSARHVTSLFIGCGGRTELFHKTLETLTDRYGQNLLRPAPKPPRKTPEQWHDSGVVFKNPFDPDAPNKVDQAALLRFHPALAEHLKNLAERPYEYALELQREELERVNFNAMESAYGPDAHAKNVFVHGNHTKQAEWAKSVAPELVSQFKREAHAVDLTEAVGKGANLTLRSRIFKADRELFAVLEAANVREKQLDDAAADAAESEKRDRLLMAHELKMAEKDGKVGARRLRDGRIVTGIGAAAAPA